MQVKGLAEAAGKAEDRIIELDTLVRTLHDRVRTAEDGARQAQMLAAAAQNEAVYISFFLFFMYVCFFRMVHDRRSCLQWRRRIRRYIYVHASKYVCLGGTHTHA
jgi:hypothetical protein